MVDLSKEINANKNASDKDKKKKEVLKEGFYVPEEYSGTINIGSVDGSDSENLGEKDA
jgi:hypothetical protein